MRDQRIERDILHQRDRLARFQAQAGERSGPEVERERFGLGSEEGVTGFLLLGGNGEQVQPGEVGQGGAGVASTSIRPMASREKAGARRFNWLNRDVLVSGAFGG